MLQWITETRNSATQRQCGAPKPRSVRLSKRLTRPTSNRSSERSGAPLARSPALHHEKSAKIAASPNRQAATSIFKVMLTRIVGFISQPSGPRRRDPCGLRLTSRRTNKPSFTGASAHHQRSRTASGGPMSPPLVLGVSVSGAKSAGIGCGLSSFRVPGANPGLNWDRSALMVGRFATLSRTLSHPNPLDFTLGRLPVFPPPPEPRPPFLRLRLWSRRSLSSSPLLDLEG